jgi:hypothetical protein
MSGVPVTIRKREGKRKKVWKTLAQLANPATGTAAAAV